MMNAYVFVVVLFNTVAGFFSARSDVFLAKAIDAVWQDIPVDALLHGDFETRYYKRYSDGRLEECSFETVFVDERYNKDYCDNVYHAMPIFRQYVVDSANECINDLH